MPKLKLRRISATVADGKLQRIPVSKIQVKKKPVKKQVILGNVKGLKGKNMVLVHGKMKAKIKTAKRLRDTQEKIKGQIRKTERKFLEVKQDAGKRINEMMRQSTERHEKRPYMEISEVIGRAEEKHRQAIERLQNRLMTVNRLIDASKGRLDTVVINIGGMNIAFKVGQQNLKTLEQKLK